MEKRDYGAVWVINPDTEGKMGVNAGPLSVFKTEGIPLTGKVSKSVEMACLLDSEKTGIAYIKPENVPTETKSKENFPKEQ